MPSEDSVERRVLHLLLRPREWAAQPAAQKSEFPLEPEDVIRLCDVVQPLLEARAHIPRSFRRQQPPLPRWPLGAGASPRTAQTRCSCHRCRAAAPHPSPPSPPDAALLLTLLSPCSCQAEPTLLRLSAPVKAFGELHRGVDVDMGGGLRGGLVLSRSSGTCTVSTLT